MLVKAKCNLILQLLHIHANSQLVLMHHQQDTHHISNHLLSILDIHQCLVIKHHQLLDILHLLVMCILLLQLTTLRQVLHTRLLHMELLHQHTLQPGILHQDHMEHIQHRITQDIIQDHNHLWSFYGLLGRCMAGGIA